MTVAQIDFTVWIYAKITLKKLQEVLNEFLKDELYNRAYNDIERQEIEIDTLKDKCVDLMLKNADYVWDEMTREIAKKRSNTRKWRAKI